MRSSHDDKNVLSEGFSHDINGTTVQLAISESKENVNKRKSGGGDFGGNQNKFNKSESSEESLELFVKGVQSLTEDKLCEYFGKYGEVERAKIVSDRADSVKNAVQEGRDADIEGVNVFYRPTRNDNVSIVLEF